MLITSLGVETEKWRKESNKVRKRDKEIETLPAPELLRVQ